MGAIGDIVLARLVYLLFAFVASFVLFIRIDNCLPFIPLAHVAIPLIAIHLIMFVEWGERVKQKLLLSMEHAGKRAHLPAWLRRGRRVLP